LFDWSAVGSVAWRRIYLSGKEACADCRSGIPSFVV
jgi:hypothetical protein